MRDCESCIHAKPFGGANDNRCGAWNCEYINRAEAIEIYKRFKWRPISEKPDAGQKMSYCSKCVALVRVKR